MVKSVTPIAGFDFENVFLSTNTGSRLNRPPFEPGTAIIADDGHKYIYARVQGGQIGVNVPCIYDDATRTMSSGAGEWTSNPTNVVTGGSFAWFRQNDL